jgi:hypothetical protein
VDASVLETVLERQPMGEHAGKSGALLERVVLADGRRVVVKRFDPEHDFVMRLTGDRRGREVELWQAGLFDRLPPEACHAILGGWFEGGLGVLVMRDLGSTVLTWQDRLTPGRCRALLRGVVWLHRAFQGHPPGGLAPLASVVGLFEPKRIEPYAGTPLIDFALRGWQYWADVAPSEAGQRVLSLALDTRPLTEALTRRPLTLAHGDLAGVNCAFDGDRLTLIDWGMVTAAPGALDIGRFLAGCAHTIDLDRDAFLAAYREEAADLFDQDATRLALLAGLVWLGWNKALDIAEHPEPQIRERERGALPWWLARAEEGLELIPG